MAATWAEEGKMKRVDLPFLTCGIPAMQMDGGGSSGLHFEGRYIVPPGRNVSNALVVAERM